MAKCKACDYKDGRGFVVVKNQRLGKDNHTDNIYIEVYKDRLFAECKTSNTRISCCTDIKYCPYCGRELEGKF